MTRTVATAILAGILTIGLAAPAGASPPPTKGKQAHPCGDQGPMATATYRVHDHHGTYAGTVRLKVANGNSATYHVSFTKDDPNTWTGKLVIPALVTNHTWLYIDGQADFAGSGAYAGSPPDSTVVDLCQVLEGFGSSS